jgi:hypothetical protein
MDAAIDYGANSKCNYGARYEVMVSGLQNGDMWE